MARTAIPRTPPCHLLFARVFNESREGWRVSRAGDVCTTRSLLIWVLIIKSAPRFSIEDCESSALSVQIGITQMILAVLTSYRYIMLYMIG